MSVTSTVHAAIERLFSRSGDYRARYGSAYGSNSVDFRKNRKTLQAGQTPDKFRALADLIPGDAVVDIGAGEGLLALELASRGRRARAIDITPRRHNTGLELIERWSSLGRDLSGCEMVLGDVLQTPELMDGFDTLVASRVVYYFGDRIDPFIADAATRVRHICLVGNASRNKRYAKGQIPGDVGEDVIYSTPEGMRTLLERHGLTVIAEGRSGKDPVVIGACP